MQRQQEHYSASEQHAVAPEEGSSHLICPNRGSSLEWLFDTRRFSPPSRRAITIIRQVLSPPPSPPPSTDLQPMSPAARSPHATKRQGSAIVLRRPPAQSLSQQYPTLIQAASAQARSAPTRPPDAPVPLALPGSPRR